MDKARLSGFAQRLLDTGKRSNLINYKRTKSTSLAVVYPLAEELFSRAEAGLSLDCLANKPNKNALGLSVEEYRKICPRVTKKNAILLYNEHSDTDAVLNSIRKKALQTIEESGVNVAYFGFGFIYYKDKGGREEICAPLLLVPVSVERESLASGIKIRISDDEVTVNPALSFKLQAEYGRALPEYSGTLLSEYLSAVEVAYSSLGFRVTDESVVGLFSFQKINMYRDIADNFDVISKNGLISALLGEEGAAVGRAAVRHGEPLPVVDADSSQLSAIALAREGRSFVLQGPPGTGKSQTITNIIADSIMLGKRVLFVSEKLAALEVVYDKISRAGLGEFCLELHSHKANKKTVIDQICKTASLEKTAISEKADGVLTERLLTVSTLDGYRDALCSEIQPINKSPRDLILGAIEYSSYPNTEYLIDNINSFGEDYLALAESALDEYSAYAEQRGMNYKENPFYSYTGRDFGYAEQLCLTKELREGVEWVGSLIKLFESLYALCGINVCDLEMARRLPSIIEVCAKGDFVCPTLFGDGAARRVLAELDGIENSANEVLLIESDILREWKKSVLTLDADGLCRSLSECKNGIARIFGRKYRGIKKELSAARVSKKGKARVKYSDAVRLCERLLKFKDARLGFERLSGGVSYYLKDGIGGVDCDFAKMRYEVGTVASASGYGIDLRPLGRYSEGEFFGIRAELPSIHRQLLELLEKQPEILGKFNTGEYDPFTKPLSSLEKKLVGMQENISELSSYITLCEILGRLDGAGLMGFVDTAVMMGVGASELKGAFLKVFYAEWADFAISNDRILSSVNRIIHDREWERFVKSDLTALDINRAKIKEAASHRRPDLDMISQGSEISMLLREGEKKRRQMSIRRLFSELGDITQKLKPCFLMSPISISTYLAPDMKFDLVIFDEASQVFPEDALGAVYRAEQLIVVGDSKQMPPTSFFASVTEEGDEWGENDAADFESILDLAAGTLPQRSLNWHYRSKSEQLIAFSNEHFYESKLITFPSASEGDGLGVDYVYAGGIFERARKVNEKEADEVVRVLFERLEKHPERSVGIVAFSTAQQSVIEDKINERRLADNRYESHFARENPERVFVKNLETVQGDERDTVIFSTAYGMGDDGRLLMNFGPLNREGGERRLNVAVTRAKYSLILVSSMHYTDIDPTRVTSRGAILLREYLKYAEDGKKVHTEKEKSADALCSEVCGVLADNGVEFDTCLGRSRAKIDIAVKGKDGEYVLAVECDGGAFAFSKNATDRERLRPHLLRGCGWEYHRIYSTDWYRDKNGEIARLLKAVKNATVNSYLDVDLPESEEPSEDFERSCGGFEFPKYEYVDVKDIERVLGKNIPAIIRAVLEVEAPVCAEWLMRRMLHLFGKDRMSAYVEEKFMLALNSSELIDAVFKNGYLYLSGRKLPMMRVPDADSGTVREIKYIHKGEIALGMREIIRQNGTLTKDGLYRLISTKLGFPRLTDAARERFDGALALLSGEITVLQSPEGERISYSARAR